VLELENFKGSVLGGWLGLDGDFRRTITAEFEMLLALEVPSEVGFEVGFVIAGVADELHGVYTMYRKYSLYSFLFE
jgi:hypothetical protein